LDIMDNHFVPNLTWGPTVVNAIAQKTSRTLWVHLMLDNPLGIIEQLDVPQQSIISVHLESPGDIHAAIHAIKNKNWRASIAIKPKTAVSELTPFLNLIDHVLLMSVDPGFSGQAFLPATEQKIDQLINLCSQQTQNRT